MLCYSVNSVCEKGNNKQKQLPQGQAALKLYKMYDLTFQDAWTVMYFTRFVWTDICAV